MQNQNPLDPLDTNQFTQQASSRFAEAFSNSSTPTARLSTLVSLQQTAQSTQALGFVGKTAVVTGNSAALTNSSATWELNVPSDSQRDAQYHQQHRVKPCSSNTYAATAGNNQPFTWNGQSADGTQWPDWPIHHDRHGDRRLGQLGRHHHRGAGRGQFGLI